MPVRKSTGFGKSNGNWRHGGCGTRAYLAWNNMWRRCTDPRNDRYAQYGGRGIKVCDRWQDFANFLADMGQPGDGESLDRKNNDGNYEPDNCRWATLSQQSLNKQHSRHIEIGGVVRHISQWIDVLALSKTTVYRRIRQGMDAKSALMATDGRRTEEYSRMAIAREAAKRANAPAAPCGTKNGYARGCRCDQCRSANAECARRYRAKKAQIT